MSPMQRQAMMTMQYSRYMLTIRSCSLIKWQSYCRSRSNVFAYHKYTTDEAERTRRRASTSGDRWNSSARYDTEPSVYKVRRV